MALRQDYRQYSFFCFADSITLFKKFIRKKGFLTKMDSTKALQLLRNEAIFKKNYPKETREIRG